LTYLKIVDEFQMWSPKEDLKRAYQAPIRSDQMHPRVLQECLGSAERWLT
jgi:hypothetical protein